MRRVDNQSTAHRQTSCNTMEYTPLRCIALAAATIGLLLYAYMRLHVFRHWQRRGIPELPARFPFGHFGPMFRQARSVGEVVQDAYSQATTTPIVGIYGVLRPMLIVRDPALVRAMFVKDFAHFRDRGVYADEERDPLSAHLFALAGDRWRHMRAKLSPVFTSGKLRASMDALLQCGDTLNAFMRRAAVGEQTVEVREIAARFNTDVIVSVAFGVDSDCMNQPETAFRRYGRKTFELSLKNSLRAFTLVIMPKAQRWLGLRSVDDDVEEFIMAMVRRTMEHRERSGEVRRDLFQLLLQLRNSGRVATDERVWEAEENRTKAGGQHAMTMNEVAAQAWVFYIAGFETSSSTMSFALYELAKNGDCQQRVQEEIDRVQAEHEGKVTYESLAEMKYLDMCIDETLRKYPIVPFLNRECTQDYQFPGTTWRIAKGTALIVPLLGMQRDPAYFDRPLEFRPERFAPETGGIGDRPYWPFGDGPRICIGMRLAKMQVKLGLMRMLQNCRVELASDGRERGGEELKFSAKSFVLAAEGGIHLRVRRR